MYIHYNLQAKAAVYGYSTNSKEEVHKDLEEENDLNI